MGFSGGRQEDDATMKEMVGGCCVCSDDRGWTENPLVYCDGQSCNVAVHQACYGIVTVPIGNWYCRKCESTDISKVKCELCPSKDGALKPTDNNRWAHVVCALYIPEVRFGNVTTMEPIILHQVPQERFNKTCYICEEDENMGKASIGACMQCNRSGCRQQFHVTCAQSQGLLCEEAGNYQDNVKYCGYCHHHYNRLKIGANVKVIPPYRPVTSGGESPDTDLLLPQEKNHSKRKLSSSSGKGRGSEGDTEEAESKLVLTGSNGTDSDPKLSVSKRRKPDLTAGDTYTDSRPLSVVFSMKEDKDRDRPSLSLPQLPRLAWSSQDDKSRGRSSTPQESPSQSPRPVTPAAPPKAVTPPSANGSSAASKVSSIVVQVPLEAAQLSSVPPAHSPAPPISSSPLATSPAPQANSVEAAAPAKRSRSESNDKGDRRRSRRSDNNVRHRKTPPPVRVKSSPEPRPPSTGSIGEKQKLVIKEEKDVKLFENGVSAPHMLGNQLAPGSSMADTLSQEMAAHSVYTRNQNALVGPHFPRPSSFVDAQARSGSSAGGGTGLPGVGTGLPWGGGANNIPQSLEQLLERQWEQGSQFLMEQAHHFDIASLLTCLHQLRAENAQLEEHVNTLLARRDHLLAVNARLAIPLVSNNPGSGGNNVGAGGRQGLGGSTASATVTSAVLTNSVSNIVENGLATQQEQFRLASMQHTRVGADAGGRSYSSATVSNNSQSSVVVRAASSAPCSGPQHALSADRSRVNSDRASSVVTGFQVGYPSQQSTSSQVQSQALQPQVVMRREDLGQVKPS